MRYDCEYCGDSKTSNRLFTSYKPKTLLYLALSIEGDKMILKEKCCGKKIGYIDINFCPFCGNPIDAN